MVGARSAKEAERTGSSRMSFSHSSSRCCALDTVLCTQYCSREACENSPCYGKASLPASQVQVSTCKSHAGSGTSIAIRGR